MDNNKETSRDKKVTKNPIIIKNTASEITIDSSSLLLVILLLSIESENLIILGV